MAANYHLGARDRRDDGEQPLKRLVPRKQRAVELAVGRRARRSARRRCRCRRGAAGPCLAAGAAQLGATGGRCRCRARACPSAAAAAAAIRRAAASGSRGPQQHERRRRRAGRELLGPLPGVDKRLARGRQAPRRERVLVALNRGAAGRRQARAGCGGGSCARREDRVAKLRWNGKSNIKTQDAQQTYTPSTHTKRAINAHLGRRSRKARPTAERRRSATAAQPLPPPVARRCRRRRIGPPRTPQPSWHPTAFWRQRSPCSRSGLFTHDSRGLWRALATRRLLLPRASSARDHRSKQQECVHQEVMNQA